MITLKQDKTTPLLMLHKDQAKNNNFSSFSNAYQLELHLF